MEGTGHVTTHLTTRWGASVENPTEPQLRAAIDGLNRADAEYDDCWLLDDAGWSISALQGGSVILENTETGEGPWHLPHASADEILEMWHELQAGNIEAIRNRGWRTGEGTYSAATTDALPPEDFIEPRNPTDNSSLGRLLTGAGSIVAIAAALVMAWQFAASLAWASTSGQLQSAEVSAVDMDARVSSHGGKRNVAWRIYYPLVAYTYRVGDKEYSGSTYAIGNVDAQKDVTQNRVEGLKAKSAAANSIQVHYRRSSPEVSSIKLAFSVLSVTGILTGLALLLFGFSLRQKTTPRTAALTVLALVFTVAAIVTIMLWFGGYAIEV